MKKSNLLITLIYILISQFVLSKIQAQNDQYVPMVKENATWVYYDSYDNRTLVYGFVIKGDTIVDSNMYKKLYKRIYYDGVKQNPEPGWYETGPYNFQEEKLIGWIREEEESKKVYYFINTNNQEIFSFNCNAGIETLLYDFDLQVGDILETCVVPYPDSHPFTIDAVYTSDLWGFERRVLENNTHSKTEVIIEGIGSPTFLFNAINLYFPDLPARLLYYCHGTDEECNQFPTSIKNIIEDVPIKIYPNPVMDKLHIEIPTAYQIDNYQILNTLGQSVKTGELYGSTPQIAIDELRSGWYTLLLHTKEHTLRETFVKQ